MIKLSSLFFPFNFWFTYLFLVYKCLILLFLFLSLIPQFSFLQMPLATPLNSWLYFLTSSSTPSSLNSFHSSIIMFSLYLQIAQFLSIPPDSHITYLLLTFISLLTSILYLLYSLPNDIQLCMIFTVFFPLTIISF